MKYFNVEMKTVLSQDEFKAALREYNEVAENELESVVSFDLDTVELVEETEVRGHVYYPTKMALSEEGGLKLDLDEFHKRKDDVLTESLYNVNVHLDDELSISNFDMDDLFEKFHGNDLFMAGIHELVKVIHDEQLISLFDGNKIRPSFSHKGVSIYPIYRHDFVGGETRKYWYGLSNQSSDAGRHAFDIRLLPNYTLDKNADEVIKEAINKCYIVPSHVSI